MINKKTLGRGDIVRISVDTVLDKDVEIKEGLGLILSDASYNRLGIALVAPIIQSEAQSGFKGFEVHLNGKDSETEGVIMVNGVRMISLDTCNASKIESAPNDIVYDVLARLRTIVD